MSPAATPVQTSIKELKRSNPTVALWFARNDVFQYTNTLRNPVRAGATTKRELLSWDFGTCPGHITNTRRSGSLRFTTQRAVVFADTLGTQEHMELVRKRLSLQIFSEDKSELVEQQKRKLREKLANIYRPHYVLDAPDDDDGVGLPKMNSLDQAETAGEE